MAESDRNARAASDLVAELVEGHLVTERDTALLSAVLSLGQAVDANPSSPGLWREYRESVLALMEHADDLSGEAFDRLLRKVFGDEMVDQIGTTS